MFRVNNKNIRMTSLTSSWCLYCHLWKDLKIRSKKFHEKDKSVSRIAWSDIGPSISRDIIYMEVHLKGKKYMIAGTRDKTGRISPSRHGYIQEIFNEHS